MVLCILILNQLSEMSSCFLSMIIINGQQEIIFLPSKKFTFFLPPTLKWCKINSTKSLWSRIFFLSDWPINRTYFGLLWRYAQLMLELLRFSQQLNKYLLSNTPSQSTLPGECWEERCKNICTQMKKLHISENFYQGSITLI